MASGGGESGATGSDGSGSGGYSGNVGSRGANSGGDSGSIGFEDAGSEHVKLGTNVEFCSVDAGDVFCDVCESCKECIGGTSLIDAKGSGCSSSRCVSRDGGGVIDGALLSA